MLIVSVGTGSAADARPDLEAGDMNLIHHATTLPGALMNAASAGWDMACRTLGACRFGGEIDREFRHMMMVDRRMNSTCPKLFTYVRYNPELTRDGLAALGLEKIDPDKLHKLDSVEAIPELQLLGSAYAGRHVTAAHFGAFV